MSQEEILPGAHARDERADSPPGSPELGACSGSVAGSVREASSSSLPASVPLPGEAGEARTKHWTAVLLCVGLFLLSAALGMLSPGTFDDDDLGRYFYTRAVFESWDHVLSLFVRPAFALLYALPARLGYGAV